MSCESLQPHYDSLPKTDEVDSVPQFPSIGYLRLRYRGLQHRVLRKRTLSFWENQHLMEGGEANRWIHERIEECLPAAIGRLGLVEASIALWGNAIPIRAWPLNFVKLAYWETNLGATNAGIRPRNKKSYEAFARLFLDSIQHLTMMGVWKTIYEPPLLQQCSTSPLLVNVELLSPTFECEKSWVKALDGKTVLVVSPFIKSFEKQMGNLRKIWPSWESIPNFTMVGVGFPYLTEENCPLTWWEVYHDICTILREGHYDVALFGCGGLGMPLAVAAKAAGKIGIHLGGHLQLLFGIYGQRHLEQEWHARWINESWIRPTSDEVPKSAQRIEGGCYW